MRALGAVPPHVHAHVGWEAMAWHTADWWRFQWECSEQVTVISARLQDSGWRDWLLWSQVCRDHGPDPEACARTITMLEADQGRYVSFALICGRKPG